MEPLILQQIMLVCNFTVWVNVNQMKVPISNCLLKKQFKDSIVKEPSNIWNIYTFDMI